MSLRARRALADNPAVAPTVRKPSRAHTPSGARAALLRAMPPVDECLRELGGRREFGGLSRAYLKLVVHRAQDDLRAEISAGRHDLPAERAAMAADIARRIERIIADDRPTLRAVVNASGVILHTNLGRAILAETAVEALEMAARSPVNIEYDLERGERGDRDAIVENELRKLSGAEAATVVNNNAAAVLLVLSSLAAGREVVVSRGELIEIGGSFRMPDVMESSGARLREVGTTNRTHPRDYESAIGPETALLLKVHPSNYRVVGFTSEVALNDLVAIGREHGIDVIEDLGAGALIDLSALGLPHEPVVADRIAAGAALVTFSGDKLLGGPQAGLIVGRRDLIAKLKANPLKRALRCDKLTLAALEATLRIYLRSADPAGDVPALRLMRRGAAELRVIAQRVCEILSERLGAGFAVEVIAADSEVGSGSLPMERLASAAVRVTHAHKSPQAIARIFRRAGIIGRIADGSFQLDMRTIEDPAVFAVKLEA